MTDFTLAPGETLLVASRGQGAGHGLWRWHQEAGGWQGDLVGHAPDLSSLAVHPARPVVYAASGAGEGRIYAWHLSAAGNEEIASGPSGGVEPAHLALDPSGRLLIIANYQSSGLALQRLSTDGGFDGEPRVYPLSGSGSDPDRQEAAHPHQVLFRDDGVVVVLDLGADLLREYRLDVAGTALHPLREIATPPGSGPRHGVFLTGGRMAVTGELSNSLLLGAEGDWAVVPATGLDGSGRARWERNYPGDIALGPPGPCELVYLANRSLCTLATFRTDGSEPRLVGEVDTGVDWPQHLLVHRGAVLVAGWDSGRVIAHPLQEGVPGVPEALFDCDGACWIALMRSDPR